MEAKSWLPLASGVGRSSIRVPFPDFQALFPGVQQRPGLSGGTRVQAQEVGGTCQGVWGWRKRLAFCLLARVWEQRL